MKYLKNITHYIRERCPNVDNEALDLLDGLLAYNPKQRLSAKSALAHAWFRTYPYPCQPFQIQKFDKDYHDYMHRAERQEKQRRDRQERIELEKREHERNRSRWGEGDKKSEKKESTNRLMSLLGNVNPGTTSTKKEVGFHKGSKDYTDRDARSRDRSRIESKDDVSIVVDKDSDHHLTKRKPEKTTPEKETNKVFASAQAPPADQI